MTEIMYISIIISFASLGFRCITGKGMIFYFLRKPLDKLTNKKNLLNQKINTLRYEIEGIKSEYPNNIGYSEMNSQLDKCKELRNNLLREKKSIKSKLTDLLLYIFKPIILCSTCMASIHTLIWYPILTGRFDINIVLVMLIVAFLNTIFYKLIEAITKLIEE